MFRQMLRSKIHRVKVTDSNLEYEGSLTVDETLLEAAGILPYEAVVISNLHNGERFTTYSIPGPRDSGVVSLNGPTAIKGAIGDQIIIFCYEFYNEDEIKRHEPRIIRVDNHNKMIT